MIVGTGGHSELEPLSRTATGKNVPLPKPPYDAVLPPGFSLPKGDSARLVTYQDQQPGFLRLFVDVHASRLTCEYFRVPCFSSEAKIKPELFDSFTLDLKKHRILKRVKA
jgi:hypothetical protein